MGIILGPDFLGWVQPDDFIDHFAEIGVLLLMLIAGLETDWISCGKTGNLLSR